jgi:hypothetical protein
LKINDFSFSRNIPFGLPGESERFHLHLHRHGDYLFSHFETERAQAMRAAGVADYKNKGCAAAELVAAIRACPQE